MKRKNDGVRVKTGAKGIWAVIIGAIVTVALVVTCALCFNPARRASVDRAEEAATSTSAASRGAQVGDNFYNLISNGTVRAGDYFDYPYSGGSYAINLYPGAYMLEVWGAQGGHDGGGDLRSGGKGGYAYGEYVVTAKTTIYAVPGGQGGSSVAGTGGGYNGGGNAGSAGSSGGGGGASHISLTNGVITTAAVKNNALIVAGGGGGAGNSYNGSGSSYTTSNYGGGAGGGGNLPGVNGAGCAPGTLSAAGTGSAAASGSQGGHRSGGNNDGGGGGGGYFGGGASAGDGGGAGGSGYVNTSKLPICGGRSGEQTGSGRIRITFTHGNTTLGALTSTALVTKANNSQAPYNSYVEYSNGANSSVTLPIGRYRLEVYGGSGGNDGYAGGRGGYTYAEYVVTAQTTVYVFPGGQGASSATGAGGGANGGGNAGGSGSSGGGGGASHISTASGVLNNSRSSAIVVAGGGGGGGNSYSGSVGSPAGASGGGGGTAGSGVAGANGAGCSGGSLTAAGTGTNSGSGSQGGHRSGDGGGGGGGYYGGGASGGDGGGGGGSSFIKSGLTACGGVSGVRLGAGIVRITVINLAPVSSTTASLKSVTRGVQNIDIPVSSFAKDPDGSTAFGSTVFYTNGTANSDACTAVELYLNAACTTSASNYVTWTKAVTPANKGDTLRITEVLRFPRSGIDGQADGVLTLYVKVRDNYGGDSAASLRSVSVLPFKITVTDTPPVELDGETITNNGVPVWVGRSKNVAAEDATVSNIYNPGGSNRYTALLSTPLHVPGDRGATTAAAESAVQVTLTAKQLLKNYKIKSGTTTYDSAYIGINNTASIVSTNTSRNFKIKEFDAGTNKATIYNPGGTAFTNTFTQITIVAQKPNTAYQVLPVTLYVTEDVNNRQLPGSYTRAIALDIVFKIDNERPTLKTNSTKLVANISSSGTNAVVNLSDILYDKDHAGGTITASTHKITGIKVPTNEYIQLDKYGNVINTKSTSGSSYYNVIPDSSTDVDADTIYKESEDLVTHVVTKSGALITGELDQSGNPFATGFSQSFISNGSTGMETAYVSYSYAGMTLTLTGQRATSSMYNGRAGAATAISGNKTAGIGAANREAGKAINPGDFYVLVHVQDLYDTADDGIWAPVGISVGNTAPNTIDSEHGADAATEMPTVEGEVGYTAYFSPMGVTINRTTTAIGYRLDGDTLKKDLRAVAADGDNFLTADMLCEGRLNELLKFTTDNGLDDKASDYVSKLKTGVAGSVNANTSSYYYSVDTFDIYVPKSQLTTDAGLGRLSEADYTIRENVTAKIGGVSKTDNYVILTGLKITINNWTNNRYLYATAYVKDKTASSAVKIAIKGYNSTPTAVGYYPDAADPADRVDGSKIAGIKYTAGGITVDTTYTVDSDGIPTIRYDIPVNSSVLITPYDLLTDYNMSATVKAAFDNLGAFTLNGLKGTLANGTFTVSDTGAMGGMATSGNKYGVTGPDSGIDYSNKSGYIANLKSVLSLIGAPGEATDTITGTDKVTFTDCLATDNRVGSNNRFHGAIASSSAGTEKLYFARTNDGGNLDGYTFEPYKGTVSGYGTLIDPVITNSAYVEAMSGSTIDFGSDEKYNIDFFVIKAKSRTPDEDDESTMPELTFTVRDRTGAGDSGSHVGTKQIKVKIKIVNRTPNLKKSADKVYTMTTAPGSANNVIELLNTDLLEDNEGDPVAFDLSYSNPVIKTIKDDATSVDGVLLTSFIRTSFSETGEKITLTALNSTQNIEGGVKIEFRATDGRGKGSKASLLSVEVEVLNNTLTYNTVTKNDGLDLEGTGSGQYGAWNINSFEDNDVTAVRYLASSSTAKDYLKDYGYTPYTYDSDNESLVAGSHRTVSSDDRTKVIVTDTDALQGAILQPVYEKSGVRYYNTVSVPTPQEEGESDADYATRLAAEIAALKAGVPCIGRNLPTDATSYVAGLIGILSGTGSQSVQTATSDKVSSYDVVYFVENGGSVTGYTATQLKYGNVITAGNWDTFFDASGRWKLTQWAVFFQPAKASLANEKIYLQLNISDAARFGGDTAGKGTARKDGVNGKDVEACESFIFRVFVRGVGLRTLDYYQDRYDGYYVVEDGQNRSVALVPTYDGSLETTAQRDIYYVGGGAEHDTDGDGTTDYHEYYTFSNTGNVSTAVNVKNGQSNTLAGKNAGMKYSDLDAFISGNKLVAGEEPFRFTDTIDVSGDGEWTYIPMSYLALPNSLVKCDETTGEAKFLTDAYVSYDIGSDSAYDRNTLADIANSMVVKCGSVEYSKANVIHSATNPSSNPYFEIQPFDLYNQNVQAAGYKDDYAGLSASPYLNRCLAVTTVNSDGRAQVDANNDAATKTAKLGYAAYKTSTDYNDDFLGCPNSDGTLDTAYNGHLMYLGKQFYENPTTHVLTGLQEHMFGIKIRKLDRRASAANLSLTINVETCNYVTGGTKTAQNADGKASVTLKINIGNSSVTLGTQTVSGSTTTVNEMSDYHIDVKFNKNGSYDDKKIGLVRSTDGAASDTTKYTMSVNYVDSDQTDEAYFYSPSLNKLGDWKAYYPRVAELANCNVASYNDTAKFKNTIDRTGAQSSMLNYFGKDRQKVKDFVDVDNTSTPTYVTGYKNMDADIPNDGKYGTSSEGYSSYFDASVSDGKGRCLTIKPRAKTVINTDAIPGANSGSIEGIKSFYAQRGLVVDEYSGTTVLSAYYPLKILVYDDCGDGFNAASYVCLEVRVYIEDRAPTLSTGLDPMTEGNINDPNRVIDVKLPAGETGSINLYQAIEDKALISKDNSWVWKWNYDKLKDSEETTDQFKYETGNYLETLLDSEWTLPTGSNANEALQKGNAKLYAPKTPAVVADKTLLPDAYIFMDYVDASGTDVSSVTAGSTYPKNNIVKITVVRSPQNNYGKIIRNSDGSVKEDKRILFKLNFKDNGGNDCTGTLYIRLEVTGKAPSLLSDYDYKPVGEINMRVGDYFNIITTPRDYFDGSNAIINAKSSAEASTSYAAYTNTDTNKITVDKCNVMKTPGYTGSFTGRHEDYIYNALTIDGLKSDTYKIRSYGQGDPTGANLGYTAIATDDTPWALRISNLAYDKNYFIMSRGDEMYAEGRDGTSNMSPISYKITANKACTKQPITVTISDPDGLTMSYTFYVTIESSRPEAYYDGCGKTLNDGLYYNDAYEDDHPEVGYFDLYMMASDRPEENYVLNEKGNRVLPPDIHTDNMEISGVSGKRNVYRRLTVKIGKIAYDLDADDNEKIALFTSGTAVFEMGGKAMTPTGGSSIGGKKYYSSDKRYSIFVLGDDYTAFTITCEAYDVYNAVDELKFYVKDMGDPDKKEKACEINIKITALYSSMSNAHAVSLTKDDIATGIKRIDSADTVYVKAADLYSGKGMDSDSAEWENNVGKPSTYQPLIYSGVPASVDQDATKSGTYIYDPDVATKALKENETMVKGYNMRIYAFMDPTANGYTDVKIKSNINFSNDSAQGYFVIHDSADEHERFFHLKEDKALVSSEFAQKYLIGGVDANGADYYRNINKSLLTWINKYLEFEIGENGVSLKMHPVTANLDVNILFYVELEKDVEDAKYKTIGGSDEISLAAGTLFYVEVKNSKPITRENDFSHFDVNAFDPNNAAALANIDANPLGFVARAVASNGNTVPEIEGVNTHTFKIFDPDDPAAMFTDSDDGDMITVAEPKRSDDIQAFVSTADYKMCTDGTAKTAIELFVDNAAHTLKVKVNRRVDKKDKNGNYMSAVPIPITVMGKDKKSGSEELVPVVILVVIENNDMSIDIDELRNNEIGEALDATTHTGYSLYRDDTQDENEVTLDIYISTTASGRLVDVKNKITYEAETSDQGVYEYNNIYSWFSDPDFTNVQYDTDSYRLVPGVGGSASKYLTTEELTVYDNANPDSVIAKVTPIANPDKNHFKGITIKAMSKDRAHVGTAYMHVVDRAGDGTRANVGVLVKLNLIVANSAPDYIEGQEHKIYPVVGSDKNALSTISINIGELVTDPNPTDQPNQAGKTDTYLRISDFTLELPEDDQIFSTVQAAGAINIVSVEYDTKDEYKQTVKITPIKGFYGTQTVILFVGDGDYSVPNTEILTVTVTINVIYNFAEIDSANFKDVTATRMMPKIVDIDTLVEPIHNTMADGEEEAGGVVAQALYAGETASGISQTFNPAENYVVTKLTVPNSYASYVDILAPDEDNKKWRFLPKKTTGENGITLEAHIKQQDKVDDESVDAFKHPFTVFINENPKPTVKEEFKDGYTFYMTSPVYPLDNTGTVLLTPDNIFKDNAGDDIKFVSATSSTPSLVKVTVLTDDTLSIQFLASGTADITVTVSDSTDEPVTYTFSVTNSDLPEPTFWQSIMISFETSKLMWIIILVAILLAILILIILLLALRRRKRKREELEAMLVSEMELEEQMMRLAAAPGMTQYNSYGYLPPTVGIQNDPGMLLGAGADAPNNNVLNLNPGQAGGATTTTLNVDINVAADGSATQSATMTTETGPASDIEDL